MSATVPSPDASTRYLDAKACGVRYSVSWRTWLRMADAGRAPRPVKFGRLVRWSLATLEEWEAGGCRPVRPTKGSAA